MENEKRVFALLKQQKRLLSQSESGYSTTAESFESDELRSCASSNIKHARSTKDPLHDLLFETDQHTMSDLPNFSFENHNNVCHSKKVPVVEHTSQVKKINTKRNNFKSLTQVSNDSGFSSVVIGSQKSAFKPFKKEVVSRKLSEGSSIFEDSVASNESSLLSFVETAATELHKPVAVRRDKNCVMTSQKKFDVVSNVKDCKTQNKKPCIPGSGNQAKHLCKPKSRRKSSSSNQENKKWEKRDVNLIKSKINDISSKDLKLLLQRSIRTEDMKVIESLKSLMLTKGDTKSSKTVEEEQHCVRCHKVSFSLYLNK